MLPITAHWRWVEGHQDGNTPYHKLDWWGKRNVDMDTHAKELTHFFLFEMNLISFKVVA